MKKMIAAVAMGAVGLTAGCGSDSKESARTLRPPVWESTTTIESPTTATTESPITAAYKAACANSLNTIDKYWKTISDSLVKAIDSGTESLVSSIVMTSVRDVSQQTQTWLENDCARTYFPTEAQRLEEFLDKVRTDPRAALIAL